MNWLRKFMYGRYGTDQLSLFLFGLYLALYLLSIIPPLGFLSWIGLAAGVFSLFRMLSKNISKRRAENEAFMKLAGPLIRWFRLQRTIHRDKEHRYLKCPNCGQQLRVPRDKGKINVTCRSCGASFEAKS